MCIFWYYTFIKYTAATEEMFIVPAQTFDSILNQIRTTSTDKRDLGAKFEILTKNFFLTDKLYQNRFAKVWMWSEWPKNDGADTGIDLVAEERDGSMCAIQCKCYADDGSISMKAVSTFLAKASSLKFNHIILVYTGDELTNNAEKVLTDSKCAIIRQSVFRDSNIDWSNYPKLVRKKPKVLFEHQKNAKKNVLAGLENYNRGKMIMACGTGKTLTSLHIAESYSGIGKIVLYAVPSISLILQTMREWSDNANIKHNYIAVCSDKSTGEDGSITELESPVSTDVATLKKSLGFISNDAMTVIFSTYQSLPVVMQALSKSKKIVNLLLCDEAHRTTGVEDKSFFTLVHKDSNIRAAKRVYMTATPRVYSDIIKDKMGKVVYSMDDESKYGPVFHSFNFTQAVEADVLTDFRVKIAIIPEGEAPIDLLKSVAHKKGEIPLDERTLLAAVWHGLNHPDDSDSKPKLLQRVIAFANRIDRSLMFAGQMTDNDNTNRSLENIVDSLEPAWKTGHKVKVQHIDGKTRALDRREKMNWLNESNNDPNTCRILSNAKCLSEGVDVPALDGVIFLNPRKSKVDVVQSVGRVMRKSPGKDYGYVILPVALPPGKEYHESLDDNKTFKVVWEVLNALRSHDENFANEINKLILDRNTENTNPTPRISVSVLDDNFEEDPRTEFFKKIKSKLVEKVGDRDYYDKYGEKLGSAAHNIEEILKARITNEPHIRAEVDYLRNGLHNIINDTITDNDVIRVISQHMVMSRVFDALFQGEFTSHNPVSVILRDVVNKLHLVEELERLEGFYERVELELSKITTREARQGFIKKMYDNFFKSAAKKETEQLGIVYTPIEIIDFILNSVQHVLKSEFGESFSNRNVKVLDPFTGTGTFLTRLLESGMLGEGDRFYEKYKNDLYANEITLLAYYIATVNIETTYSSLRKSGKYVPFEGASYTDTLQLDPKWRFGGRHRHEESKLDEMFRQTHDRIKHQRGSHLHVIVGNPPYSGGQSNYNDQNQNMTYPAIDQRTQDTYIHKLKSINPNLGAKNSMYDSYIRSIRWASDRIGESGIIGFVTNASFIRSDAAAGVRACLQEEFTDVWVFDLLGKKGVEDHGRNIFEYTGVSAGGTTTQIAIVIFVKNPIKEKCTIHYHSLTKEDYSGSNKRDRVKELKSINGIKSWQTIKPDKHYDWLDQRTGNFTEYLPMGSKDAKAGKGNAVFRNYWIGVATSRDVWAYNSSKNELSKNIETHIEYCNEYGPKQPDKPDEKRVKWSPGLSDKLKKYGKQKFSKQKIRIALYRPFFKQCLYLDKIFTHRPAIAWNVFPENNSENLAIVVPDKGNGAKFTGLITDVTPDLHLIAQSQIFPFKTKDMHLRARERESTRTQTRTQSMHNSTIQDTRKILDVHNRHDSRSRSDSSRTSIPDEGEDEMMQDNITDITLKEYHEYYNDNTISKEDIFYYVYGLLHHPEYRKKYANNLTKELPHIPMAPDFWTFSKIGKKLADLHLSYETCEQYDLGKPLNRIPDSPLKIKWGSQKKDLNKNISSQNQHVLKIDGVVVYDNLPICKYHVNGRTPLGWFVDRYEQTIDKKSEIENYPLQNVLGYEVRAIIERLVYVGDESDRLIAQLPKEFEPKNWTSRKTGLDVYK